MPSGSPVFTHTAPPGQSAAVARTPTKFLTDITSTDGSVIITNPTGPVVNLSVPAGSGGGTGGVGAYPAIPFFFVGSLFNSTSPSIRPHLTIHAVGLSAHLDTTSYAVTTVALLKNGTAVASFNIAINGSYGFTTFAPVTFIARTDSYTRFS